MDADGCISIRRTKNNASFGGVMFSPRMQIKCIDVEMLEFVHATLGGHLNRKHQQSQFNNLPCNFAVLQWQIQTRAAYGAAQLLLPFLKVKRRQAETVLRYYDEMPPLPTKNVRLPDEEIARRQALYEETSFLNKRGYLPRMSDVVSRACEPQARA